ncbi:MAG: lyase family protein, partial [Bdellovibrionales bacterium]
MQRWLDVEVALATAQEALGIVPIGVAAEMRKHADIRLYNLEHLKERTRVTKHSLMPLLTALESRLSPFACAHLHRGATTQDIQDTALALEMRDIFALMRRKIHETLELLKTLMQSHQFTLMAGRTHSMPASPITLGIKFAGWADELMRDLERLDQAEKRVCVVQLFGAVGTQASFDSRGQDLIKKFAELLGLGVPSTSWHASRDRVAEFTFVLAMVASSLARFADELRTLNRVEIREVIMGFQPGEIGSSCMPHKRNPEDAEQIVVLGRLAKAQVGPMLEAMIVEHERDYRGTRMEWPCVMQAAHYSYNAA